MNLSATHKLLLLFLSLPLSAQLQMQTDIGVHEKNVIRPYMLVDYARMFDGFPIGATFVNHGSTNLDSAYVSATIENMQGVTIYTDTIGPFVLLAQDSLFVYENQPIQFDPYNPAVETAAPGEYILSYSALTNQDEDSLNNSVNIQYTLEDDNGEVTLSTLNVDSLGLPRHQKYYPNNFTTEYQACVYWQEPNTYYFRGNPYSYYFDNINIVPHVDSGEVLVGSELFVNILEWNDNWSNIDDTLFSIPNAAFQDLSLLTYGYYYPSSNNEIDSVINISLESHFYPNSQKRYLVCAQSFENQIKFGFDTTTLSTNYTEHVKQPIGAILNDGDWNLLDPILGIPSITVGFSNFHSGVQEYKTQEITIFPNPVNDRLDFSLNAQGNATVEIIDLQGRVISQEKRTLEAETNTINTQSLKLGSYVLLVRTETGQQHIAHFIRSF